MKQPTVEQKMVCPNINTCKDKPIWNKPVWEGTKIVGHEQVNQGHCIPHRKMETCKDNGKKCPACVPVPPKENKNGK